MPEFLLRFENVGCRRGSFELEIPEWSVEPGQVVGVVGPNGAGKTTLLRLLPGLDVPGRGTLRVLGLDPARDPVGVRLGVAFMSDDQALFDLSLQKLLYVLSGYYPTWDEARVKDLLERFSLDPSRRVSQLSRGEGTRVRLLLALAWRPRLLVLDEPAMGLDLQGRRALLTSVLEVAGEGDASVVISSHMLSDIARGCDSLLVLRQGQVVRQGPTSELVGDDLTLEEAMVQWGAA
ncbi:MAG: ABC transporter ATP-binding protein [Myxococcota bacterium]|jgi:ABC-2 type transport system ATP-binding protein|nr:ABC transporter ATP-binding protein [Myxococcota bacterium]